MPAAALLLAHHQAPLASSTHRPALHAPWQCAKLVWCPPFPGCSVVDTSTGDSKVDNVRTSKVRCHAIYSKWLPCPLADVAVRCCTALAYDVIERCCTAIATGAERCCTAVCGAKPAQSCWARWRRHKR